MLDSPHTSAPMLMRGNTPPTTRSPPHRSRPAGYPPNRQPATVGEEERGWRGPTSRRTSTRAAPERRPPPTACAAAPHHHQPLSPATRRSPHRTPLQMTQTAGNPHTGDGHRRTPTRCLSAWASSGRPPPTSHAYALSNCRQPAEARTVLGSYFVSVRNKYKTSSSCVCVCLCLCVSAPAS